MRKLMVSVWIVLCTSTTTMTAMIEVPGVNSTQSGVAEAGGEFLAGVTGAGLLALSNGQQVAFAWPEGQQGLVITGFSSSSGPYPRGLCTTNTVTIEDSDEIEVTFPATWQVTNPCDGDTLMIDITPLTQDGFFACSISLDFVQDGVQFAGTLLDWVDISTQEDVCDDILFGITKQTSVDVSQTTLSLDFSQPFQIFYEDQLAFDFR